MAENKKYFWFKLKEDFFLSKEIKIIRKMPSGAEILIVLFKLQLQALKTGGIIEIDGLCGTVEDELSILIDEDTNLIKLALITLGKFSLLNQINGTDIQMLLHKELIGQETASTIRSRKSRGIKKLEKKEENKTLQCNTDATNCNTDIDKELEKEIDIYLTDKQKESLKEKYPGVDIDFYLEKILDYEKRENKKYTNYNLTIQKWIKNDIARNNTYDKITVINSNKKLTEKEMYSDVEIWEE